MFEEHIDKLVPKLTKLRRNPDAVPFYDLMSGALVWSDEKLSDLDSEELGCLRGILRFRSSLIIGQPDARFERLWELLKEKCPTWIGLDPSRCMPSAQLAEVYYQLKTRG